MSSFYLFSIIQPYVLYKLSVKYNSLIFIRLYYIFVYEIGDDYEDNAVDIDGARIDRFILEVMAKHQRCKSVNYQNFDA